MKSVLITGIGGFLGGAAARYAFERNWLVAGIGITPVDPDLEPSLSLVINDAVSIEAVSDIIHRTGKPDYLIHAAGNGKVGVSWDNPFSDFTDNVSSTAALIEVLRRESPDTVLVLPSSAAVYGDPQTLPTAEDTPRSPISPYGVHKAIAEDLCIGAHQLWGLNAVILRFFSLYGPGLKKQLLWDVVGRLMPQPEELRLSGLATATRDFLYVTDCVELMFLAAEKHRSVPQVLNGGSGTATSIEDIANLLIKHVSPKTLLAFDHSVRPGDPLHMRADTRLITDLGFSPRTCLTDGVKSYADWAMRQLDPTDAT